MNKINLVIDMQIDFLQFSIFTSSQKSIVLFSSNKTITKQKSLTFTQILKRFIFSVVTQLSEKSSSFSKIMKSSNSINFASSFNSMNIAIIETAAYKLLVKRLNVTTFMIIITKIDWLLKTARNKLEDFIYKSFHMKRFWKKLKLSFLQNIMTI